MLAEQARERFTRCLCDLWLFPAVTTRWEVLAPWRAE
jgi:hypothetical protein